MVHLGSDENIILQKFKRELDPITRTIDDGQMYVFESTGLGLRLFMQD